jgi:hypothetical protein
MATRTHVRLLRIYHLPFQSLVDPLPHVIPPPDYIISSVAFGIEQPGTGLLVVVPHQIVAAEDLELGGHPVIRLQQSDRRCLSQGEANSEGRGRGNDVSWPSASLALVEVPVKLRQALVDILLAEELVQEDDSGFIYKQHMYHELSSVRGLESNLCMGRHVPGR